MLNWCLQKVIDKKSCLYIFSQNGLLKCEFCSDIEYDNLSLEMVDFDFFLKIIESSTLKTTPSQT